MSKGPGRPKGEKTEVISFRVPAKYASDIAESIRKFIKTWYPQDKYKRK